MPSPPPTLVRPRPEFLEDFETRAAGLRAALTELLASVDADPSAPQDVSRRFGINRTMAWKVCRTVTSQDTCEVVQHLLGDSGVRILVAAFEAEGAPPAVAAAVHAAVDAFDHMVAEHAGSRAGLELMLTSMLPERVDPARLESSHELAFQGNSAVHGVQTRTRFGAQVVAPNAEQPDRVDVAMVTGHAGFRRLRPVTGWQLSNSRVWGDGVRPHHEPLDANLAPGDVPLLRQFCSGDLPAITERAEGATRYHELGPGPVGNTAAFDVVFGWLDRSLAPIYGDAADDVAEHGLVQDTPAETLHFDLLLHHALPVETVPRFCLVNLAQGRPQPPHSQATSAQLPWNTKVQSLGRPPSLAAPGFAGYGDVIAHACERMGHGLDGFRAYRVTLRYPPVPSLVTLYYPLAQRS
ncbi:hypothetical protein Pla163_22030 [Planctomycetes bacterium Pla163]|uniref:Uncharacterized protein n=1 Tax=Rohdeia mirabilis TaxID=2528008 RepID=A0A518D0Q0_9BACT|nr:hypothetical protein Pla163_22030 [Planctomycetes bacterium Pla163]